MKILKNTDGSLFYVIPTAYPKWVLLFTEDKEIVQSEEPVKALNNLYSVLEETETEFNRIGMPFFSVKEEKQANCLTFQGNLLSANDKFYGEFKENSALNLFLPREGFVLSEVEEENTKIFEEEFCVAAICADLVKDFKYPVIEATVVKKENWKLKE